MATPRLISVRDFNTSRFAQLADTSAANISDIIARAETAIESQLKRPILPTTYTERYRPHSAIIYLEKRPLLSVTSVMRGLRPNALNITVVPQLYYINKERGTLEFETSLTGYIVDITYVAGFTTVPEDIKEAMLLKAALFAFTDLEVYGSGDAKEPGILYMNRDIDNLLMPYKQMHNAFTA